jgi:hypothetical protein
MSVTATGRFGPIQLALTGPPVRPDAAADRADPKVVQYQQSPYRLVWAVCSWRRRSSSRCRRRSSSCSGVGMRATAHTRRSPV